MARSFADAASPMVPVSPWLVWCGGLPRIPGLLPSSTLFRLVCFGGSSRTAAVDQSSGRRSRDGRDRRAPGGAGCAQGAADGVRARPGPGRRAQRRGRAVSDDRAGGVDTARLAGGGGGGGGGG